MRAWMFFCGVLAVGITACGEGATGRGDADADDSGGATADASPDSSADASEGGSCEPTTCSAEESQCGILPDGCGGEIDCGGCDGRAVCAEDEEAKVCREPEWRVLSEADFDRSALQDVWGSAEDDAWIVGDFGIVKHYDGDGWSTVSSPNISFTSVTGRGPNDVVIAGAGGVIEQYDGSQWRDLDHPSTGDILGALSVPESTDIWTVGQFGFGNARYYNGEEWVLSDTYTAPPGEGQLRALWGARGDHVWAAGDGRIVFWNGEQWQLGYEDFTANDIYGLDTDDVWAVGNSYTTAHFDGTRWRSVSSPTPTFGDLLSVWGSTSDDVWAVGHEGVALHWDGEEWSEVETGTSATLLGVWGSGAADVWAVGAGGVLLHYGLDAP